MPPRPSSRTMAAASIGALTIALTGCGQETQDVQEVDSDYARICVEDPDGEGGAEPVRVDDDECEDDRGPRVGGFFPMWVLMSSSRAAPVPAVGSPVPSSAGWTTGRPPASATVARGLPRDGTAVGKSGVSRGFGGSKTGWGS
ncbi:hypothetical protein RCG67_05885 [Kocuria sp. CPCC 205292]|uniref:hypothetical protein n=1 Tax=Kocuria cellulosilytica TaxID=3071451 RepID=UPI0034D6A6CA